MNKPHAHSMVLDFLTLYFQDYAKDCIEKHNLHLSLCINTIVILATTTNKTK